MESVELWDTGRLLSQKRATLCKAIILPLYIVMDVFFLVMAWIIARFFSGLSLTREAFLHQMPLVVGIIFLALVYTKTYRRVWSRAQIRDCVVLASTLLIANVIAVSLMLLVEDVNYGVMKFSALMFVSSFFPVVGVRVLRECINGVLHAMERFVIADKEDTDKVLIFGGGTMFRLFLKDLISRAGHNNTLIVGLLDDDINLRGRIISGYRVLGVLEQLPEFVKKTGADRVLITCDLSPEKQQEVVEILKDCGVGVFTWHCAEVKLN
jgi:FlaA1/EpsC-like NDP-sugar epimerase